MEFKQGDFVQTRNNTTSVDGHNTIGRGSLGEVTEVEIKLSDGSVHGIEVSFEGGRIHGHYNSTQLIHAAGNPPHHKEDDARDLSHMMRASYPHGEPYSVGKRENRPAEMKKFRTDDPLMQARKTVHFLFYNDIGLPIDDVYIVWFCSAVKNWKALVSTNVLDNCYYEVTHNGENNETYVDRYVKEINVKVRPDGVADFTVVNDFGRIY